MVSSKNKSNWWKCINTQQKLNFFWISLAVLILPVAVFAVLRQTYFSSSASSGFKTKLGFAYPLGGDVFTPEDEMPQYYRKMRSMGMSIPHFYNADYLAGKVAVNIIAVQCQNKKDNSACTQTWDKGRLNKVKKEIKAGLNWWKNRLPKAQLQFILTEGSNSSDLNISVPNINITTIGYEPISKPHSAESDWMSRAMDQLQIANDESLSFLHRVSNYNKFTVELYETDWAFTIFVVDSMNDSDNRFSDGYFAYAIPTPAVIVMTYGLDYYYGTENMDAVLAHETGHIFGALDQYVRANLSCIIKSGYLRNARNTRLASSTKNIDSQVSEAECRKPIQDGIMRGGLYPFNHSLVSGSSKAQLGYADLLSYQSGKWVFSPDSVLDVAGGYRVTLARQLSVPEEIVINATITNVSLPMMRFTKKAHINYIKGIGAHSPDNSKHFKTFPLDGRYNTTQEVAVIKIPSSYKGTVIKVCITGKIGGTFCQNHPIPKFTLSPKLK